MILYANGCSMTYGHELPEKTRIRKAWPGQLASFLNINHVNGGNKGASNQKILRTSIQWITEHLDNRNAENLFVIIGWSAPSRKEYRIEKSWVDILPQWYPENKIHRELTEFHQRHMFDLESDVMLTLQHCYCLQSILEVNKIPYVFFKALNFHINDVNKRMVNHYVNHLNSERFYGLNDRDKNMFYLTKQFPQAAGRHPLEEGHNAWARILHAYIKDRNLTNV